MVDQIIRPWALPDREAPNASEKIPVDNGSTVGGATVEAIVLSGRPTASQAEAESGVNAVKAMTPLTTKQAIFAQGDVRFASAAQGNKADEAAPATRSVGAGIGLDGGGDLSADRVISLSSDSILSLGKADTAVQPGSLGALAAKSAVNNSDWSGTPLSPSNGGLAAGGSTGQALVKASNLDYDATWQTIAAATAVSYAPQSLTTPQQQQARSNISVSSSVVSSMDARSSLIVNGNLQTSQENATNLGTTNNFYFADQFFLSFSASTAAMSVQLLTSVRTLSGNDRVGEFKTTTAKASLGATDFVTISTVIEGSRPEWKAAAFGTANAKPFALRFEFAAPAGLYHVHLQNSAGNRHCAVPFTVQPGEANFAVVRTIIVPPDTSGTWPFGDGDKGLVIDFVLAAGATLTGGTASTWGATARLAATTQFNILSSTSNVSRIADMGLKNDPDSTGVYGLFSLMEQNPVYRSERYSWFLRAVAPNTAFFLGQSETSTAFSGILQMLVPMAKTPTLQADGGANFAVYSAGAIRPASTGLSIISSLPDNRTIALAINVASGLVAGQAGSLLNSAGNNPRIGFIARL